MKIGITEHADAGINFAWEQALPSVDGAILITKNLNPVFQKKVLNLHKAGFPVIIHCTCTGWGNTTFEPCVPKYEKQLNWLKDFIEAGFPAERIVLRVDPVFPSEAGITRVLQMIDYYHSLNLPEDKIRYRMSIVDEYNHVKDRYIANNFVPLYGDKFGPSTSQVDLVGQTLASTGLKFATCAEDALTVKYPDTFVLKGCISHDDLDILGLQTNETMSENPQKRTGCHCLSCKQELFDIKLRQPCPHNCIYCFWKN